MTISEKLAFEFIKEHDCFQFDTAVNRAKMTSYDIDKAFFVVGNMEIHPFVREPGYHTVYVILPFVLNPDSATLKDMLRIIQTKSLDATDIVTKLHQTWQVTANRLKVLEQMMKNSGVIVTKSEDFKFDPTKIPQVDEEGTTILPYNQNRLSEVNGVIIDGQKYYPADAIEQICSNADKEYSKLYAKYEELWRKVDPKFIETHCRMMQLSKDLSTSCLETLNTLIDKLTEALKTK